MRDDGAETSGELFETKFAAQDALGDRFLSRPVLRAFVTYAP